jgi:hypothetical protein
LRFISSDLSKGYFKRASFLKKEFDIPEESIRKFSIPIFRAKISKLKIDHSKSIISIAKIPNETTMPIISAAFDALFDKQNLDNALYLAEEFDLDSPNVPIVATKVFAQKLKVGLYKDAAVTAKKFKLPKDEVRQKVKMMLESLKSRKKVKKIDMLEKAFGLNKKGVFSKLFGR